MYEKRNLFSEYSSFFFLSQGGTNEKRKHREPRGGGRNSSGTPGGGVVFTSCQQPTTTEPETAKHTVTFNADNGTEATSVTVEDGKTVAKPETDPTKNGYDFGGWQNGEAAYDFAAAVTSNLTLTAKWTAKTYTITYELNGGTNSSENPDKYTIESEDITLKDPTAPADKPNFGGWFKEAEFKTQVTKIARGSTGDLALYAYFSEKAIVKHSVKVICGEDEVYSGEVIDEAALSEDALNQAKAKIPDGYELEGCYSDAACTVKFDFTKAITADTVIYAKITAKTFTVTFEGLEAKQTVEYGKTASKPETDPTKDGFTFKGWLLGDAEYNFDTPVTGDITLKAKWEEATKPTEPVLLNTDGGFIALSKLDESAKIAIVLESTDSADAKAGWGAGEIVAQKSSDWTSGPKLSVPGLKTPKYGKTITAFVSVKSIMETCGSDYDGFYVNVYNDAKVKTVSLRYGIPDDKSVDLSGLDGYDSEAGGLVKTFDGYSQYCQVFTLSLDALGAKDYNSIEIIAQNISGDENILGEWEENLGAFVGKSTDIYNGAKADNMGYKGHFITWADSSYDTLMIQSNASKSDKIIVTAINLSYVE